MNEEIKRRTNVVGDSPDGATAIRLVHSALLEIWDAWHVSRRYFSQESMCKVREPEPLLVAEPQPLTLAPLR